MVGTLFCGPSTLFKDSEELLGKWKKRLWVMDNVAALHLFLTTQVNGKEILWSHL